MTLIGLIGVAGSGKDTVGLYIKDNYNGETRAFAQPIKELTRTLFLFDDEQLYGSKKNIIDTRWNITPRETWQNIGTNIMQFQIYGLLPGLLERVPVRQFWIHHFRLWYQDFISKPENNNKIVIITDVRFPHELSLISELGGQLIKIIRPELNTNTELYQHCSETSIAQMEGDYLIINNGTLDELYEKVDYLMQKISV